MNNRQASQKFYYEIFQNSRNYESFLPQKFGAIRYAYNLVMSEHPQDRYRDQVLLQYMLSLL